MSAGERAFVPFRKADLEQSIPARFAQQVALHGDRLAVQCGADRLSYAELGRLAHGLARGLLARRGPDPEPVVLLVRQGAPLVAAILGILEAGKFYVPLDPSAPAAELAQQIAASATRLIIADQECQPVAERFATADRVVWQLERIGSLAESDDPAIAPDAYAYVFYTSGSTGAAKGVVDSHRNVLHNVMRYTNALRIGADDRLTLLQAPHFSGAVSSLFGALLNGAAVFPFDLKRQSIGEIARAVVEHEITIWHSVPALFELLVETGQRFPSLRLIRLEGDQASRRHLELFRRAFGPGCTLVNGLGATETGITRQFFVGHDTAVTGNTLPLGYATEDMATLILGDAGEALGPGEVGEIAIRSHYLAVGYWRDPARTAAAFAPLPGGSGERLYRTGDLGRLRPDGCLEYLGRRDFRPRLRGRWVDVDAIEAALLALDDVQSAVVKVCQLSDGGAQLVGYVVPTAGAAPASDALRRRLAERLPAESLPARFVLLDRLPLNANFKVDRNALPSPDPLRPRLETRFAAPRDPIEQELALIWREVLGLDRVGIDDDFFDLGGDSLAALQVAHLVEERIATGLPVSDLLQAPTVALMAERLRAARPAGCLVAIQPAGSQTPLFGVHDQSGEVLCFRELAARLAPDRPFYGLRMVKPGSIEEMAARHVEAIRAVQPAGPYLLAGNCFGGVVAFEAAQQLVGAGQRVALVVLLDTALPCGRLRETRGRVRRLLWNVADLSAERARDILRQRWRRAGDRLWRGQRGSAAALPGPDVPRACRVASRRYRPRRYAGAVILVWIGRETNQGRWERLADDFHAIELPLVTRRLDADVVRPPYVDQLAELLRRELGRGDHADESSGLPGAAARYELVISVG